MNILKPFLGWSLFLTIFTNCHATNTGLQDAPKPKARHISYSEGIPRIIFDPDKLSNTELYYYPASRLLSDVEKLKMSDKAIKLKCTQVVYSKTRVIYFDPDAPYMAVTHDEKIIRDVFQGLTYLRPTFDLETLTLKLDKVTCRQQEHPKITDVYQIVYNLMKVENASLKAKDAVRNTQGGL